MKYTIPSGATEVEILDPVFTINQPPSNQPPTADAGTDKTITLPTNSVTLIGRGTDPEGKAITFNWTKVSGTGGNILSPNSANTDVTGLTEGNYAFRLTVKDDTGATKTDDVNVTVKPQVVVVPGKYEGFGASAVGGSNSSDLRTVKTQTEFFAALGSNRTIKFGANCTLNKAIYATNLSYLTIDGNGFDVTFSGINDDGISFEGSGCHHIILTGVRVIDCTGDCINCTDGAHDILIDHCSVYGSGDGNIDIAATGGKNFTVSWCFIGNGSSGWSGASLGTSQNISYHHNLFAPEGPGVGERCPLVHAAYSPVGSPNADIRNNLLFKWERFGMCINYGATANVVNNYLIPGGSGGILVKTADGSNPPGTGYVAGNVIQGTGNPNTESNHAEYPISDPYKITMTDAKTAAQAIKTGVGLTAKTTYEKSVLDSISIN